MSRLDAIRDWEDRVKKAGYHASVLASQVPIGEHQLRRQIKRLTGLPTQHWIDRLRVRDACRLLLAGEPAKDIAFQLGFKQVSHFCVFFKREKGVSPSAWRSSPD
jgi:AraC-like DNA-binding protein